MASSKHSPGVAGATSSNSAVLVAGVAGVLAGAAGYAVFGWSIPVALGIVGLLAILAVSYRQTILAYPGGGGAHLVASHVSPNAVASPPAFLILATSPDA